MVKAGGTRSIAQAQHTDATGNMAEFDEQFAAMAPLRAAQEHELNPHKGPHPDRDAGEQGGDVSAGHGAALHGRGAGAGKRWAGCAVGMGGGVGERGR